MPFADLPHARIHYSLSGDNSLPALVLSTSLGTNFSIWDAQVPEFEKHFRLLRFDMRGHGQSSVTPGPYTIAQLGRDVLALLDKLKLELVSFCGLSLGGMIGQVQQGKLAIVFPQEAKTGSAIYPAPSWDKKA